MHRYFSLQALNKTGSMEDSRFTWAIYITLLIGIGLSHRAYSRDFSQSSLTKVPVCPTDQSIESINLNKNNIQELFLHSFNGYYDLTEIYLASNGLHKIHDGTFDNIHNLGRLFLDNNDIVQLPTDFGPSTRKLLTLCLRNALEDLRLLTYPYFCAFTRLRFIKIGLNDIVNLNDSFFPPNVKWIFANTGTMDTFPPMSPLTPRIEVLAFSKHQLTTISQNAVAGLYELRELFMNWNKIRNFPNFSQCGKLNLMQLKHNELSYIPRQHIEGLKASEKSTSQIIGWQIWQIFPTFSLYENASLATT